VCSTSAASAPQAAARAAARKKTTYAVDMANTSEELA
jgi:hypothetical protein